MDPGLLAKTVRGWHNDLNDAVLGEVGISWEKYHKVLDKMKEFVKELEQKIVPEAGPF
jgi:hypothetical protein